MSNIPQYPVSVSFCYNYSFLYNFCLYLYETTQQSIHAGVLLKHTQRPSWRFYLLLRTVIWYRTYLRLFLFVSARNITVNVISGVLKTRKAEGSSLQACSLLKRNSKRSLPLSFLLVSKYL